jgi:Zn-finger protein
MKEEDVLKNSHRFFNNQECPFFPCHSNFEKDINEYNCLFCFCPLIDMDDCGGNYEMITLEGKVIKDCTYCTLPHEEDKYDYIIEKLQNKKYKGK